jgi:ribosomal protein S18 acetylase RimI-like enzyme
LQHPNRLSVRRATDSDLPDVRRVIADSRRAHLQLDWWTVDDWIGNPGFLLAEQDGQIVGLGLGVRDASPVAWLRALVAKDGLGVGQLLNALLPPLLDALRRQNIRAINCMAWPDWLAEKLPEGGFQPLAQVVTLHKDDMNVPSLPPCQVMIRPIDSADLRDVSEIDHAAFEPDWWYGQTTFFRAMRGASRFVIAEQNSLPVGYAFAHANGTKAHVTRLAVHPLHQRHGIGAQLMADLIEHSGAQGIESMSLNTQTHNHSSLRLYHRMGFCNTGTIITTFRRLVE